METLIFLVLLLFITFMKYYLINNIVARVTERKKSRGGSRKNLESHSSNKPTVFIYNGYY